MLTAKTSQLRCNKRISMFFFCDINNHNFYNRRGFVIFYNIGKMVNVLNKYSIFIFKNKINESLYDLEIFPRV